MFAKRLISAVVLLALAGVALVMGGTFLLVLSALVALLGIFEILRVDHMHKTVPGYISYVSVLVFYLFLYWQRQDLTEIWIVATLIAVMAAYVFTYPKYQVKDIALCVLAIIYVGVLISFLYRTRCISVWLVWLILIGASGSDTFAYLTGMLIGKHHFSELSPKKTVEGCIGGVVGAALLAGIYSIFLPDEVAALFDMNVHVAFVLIGLVSSVVSQIGDLAASAIKRNYEIKDFSDLIPGHGGILDRFDSILFVSPLVYYILYYFLR